MAVERATVELRLDRPIYVEFAILDLSKTLMHDFHHNYIKRKYPDSALLFNDTDSLPYQIQMDNVCEDFYADKHLFDFSGYGKESPFYNAEDKKVISKMKDELNGEIIEEFFTFKAKIYSLKTKKKEMKKANGVKKNLAIKTS